MSEQRTQFERELARRLTDAAPAAAPEALERATLAILKVPQRRGLIQLTSTTGSVPWVQAAATVAVVVAALVVGYTLGRLSPRVGDGPSATPSPSLMATPAESPSTTQLPALRMPHTAVVSSPGDYGWTGEAGSAAWMHNVVGDGETQILFAIEDDCFAQAGERPEPVPVTVAGLDGWYLEPFDGPRVWTLEEGETTGVYALPIDGRTLCVYLTWDALTSPDKLDAARQVVESIRGQAYGSGIRIVFDPGEGWDTG